MTTLWNIPDADNCIGCGICAHIAPTAVRMHFDQAQGRWRPIAVDNDNDGLALAESLCPKSSSPYPEPAPTSFGVDEDTTVLAGNVTDPDRRARSSSGGMLTWLLQHLLASGRIDGVIHVANRSDVADADDRAPVLLQYRIARDQDTIAQGAGSHYYPTTIDRVLDQIAAETDSRFAVVGVPCVIAGLDGLRRAQPAMADRLPFLFSVFCGHMKTAHFAQYLAWSAGVRPRRLDRIAFRATTDDAGGASDYAIRATDDTGREASRKVAKIWYTNWQYSLFRHPACAICDDITGRTADASFGDAWIPPYADDPRGTSLVIARNAACRELFAEGLAKGSLDYDTVDEDAVVRSQQGGIRNRMEPLSWRLDRFARRHGWRPGRLTEQDQPRPGRLRCLVLDFRGLIAWCSVPAFRLARTCGILVVFKILLLPPVALAWSIPRCNRLLARLRGR